jgi:hypothetical protein
MIALVAADIYAIASIIVAVVLVIATFYLGRITRRYVELTKALVESQTNPLLLLDAELVERHSILNVFIKKIGQSFAYNVELEVVKNEEGEDDFVFLVEGKVRKFQDEIIKNSLERLSPGQKRVLVSIPLLDNLAKSLMGELKKRREVKVGYTNVREKKCERQNYLLDFPYWINLWERSHVFDDDCRL